MVTDQTLSRLSDLSPEERVKDLVRRVAEAEAELQAFIESQVDAVMDPISATPILLREAQANLLESEARFRSLAETTSAALFITQAGCISLVNPAATLITGYVPEKLLGIELQQIVHPAHQRILEKYVGSSNGEKNFSRQQNLPARIEIMILTASGEERWLDLTAGTTIYSGKPATIYTAFDVTDRVRAEEALQSAKAELEEKVLERTDQLRIELQERRKAEEDLRLAKAELEKRVEERTQDLLSANEELATAVEELQVIEEELRQQNEALATARLAVEAERKRYFDLFDFAPDGYLVTDIQGLIQEANRAISSNLNVPKKFLVGKPLVNYIDLEDRPVFRNQIRQFRVFLQDSKEEKSHNANQGYLEAEVRFRSRRSSPFIARLIGLATQPGEGAQPTLRWQVHDITQRVQMVHALQESEARLQTVLNGAPIILWAMDRQGIITMVKGRGLPERYQIPERAVGCSVQDLVPDRNDIKEYLQRALAGEEVNALVESEDGTIFDTHYVPQVSPEGEVVGVITVSTDVTSRIEAERALLQTSELLEKVFSSIDTSIAYLDPDFNFLRVNRAYAQEAGYDPNYFIGKNHFDLYPHEENRAIFTRVVETGEPYYTYEKLFVYPDQPERGETYWDWSLQPVKDLDGKLQGVVLSLVNVTGRKQAEDQARQNAARAELLAEISRSLVEAGPNYSAVINTIARKLASSVGDTCILRLVSEDGEWLSPAAFHHPNPQTLQLLGEVIASTPRRVGEGLAGEVFRSGEPKLVPVVAEEDIKYLRSTDYGLFLERIGLASILVVPLRAPDGIIGTLSLSRASVGHPYNLEDQTLLQSLADQASLAIANARLYRDLENALRQEQAAREQLILAERHAALSRMVASVAHELNNPIQTIKNCLYLTQLDTPADSQVHDYLGMAFSESQRIARLVSQLRELYRPNRPEDFKQVELMQILAEVRALLEPHLQHEHVSWQATCKRETVLVAGVVDQLKQVFLNISLNAIEAMQPEGGLLVVDTSFPAGTGQVAVAFKDTGPGIPEEHMTRLFDPFFTTKENGTGLGLPICYDIIRAHGGRILVESQPGEGATFTIILPVLIDK
jgi:PAS domain S-box-containing protein